MEESDTLRSTDVTQPKTADDLTGRDRMVGNVLASWAGQFVFIVAGFVMPRMIDRQLGQDLLGIWDFAWSVVAYFSLIQIGVVGSVNRYVAKCHARGDTAGVNEAVSSVSCMLVAMAGIVVLLTIGVTLALPYVLADKLGQHLDIACWVVFLLGVSLGVQTVSAGYAGVLTGHHRWGIHNGIKAGGYVVSVTGMIVVLVSGGGLLGMSVVYLCGEAIARVVSCFAAYKVCPGLGVRLAHARWTTARSMLGFGGKSFVPQIAELLLHQTVNVLVLGYLGPGALAIYARPRSFIRHIRTLVYKISAVLVPSVSSLQATGHHTDIRDLIIKATRYAAYVTLPMTVALVIVGGPVLRLWMGPRYDDGLLIAVLAMGYTGFIIQLPVMGILGGMNRHGRPGLANLAGCICAAVVVAIVVGPMKLGLVWVAIAATAPLLVVFVIYMPIYACRQAGIPVWRYVRKAFAGPVLCVIPFAACLMASRLFFQGNAALIVLVGCLTGLVFLIPTYWRWVLPRSLKNRASLLFLRATRGNFRRKEARC